MKNLGNDNDILFQSRFLQDETQIKRRQRSADA